MQDIIIEPEYLDVQIPAGATFVHPTIADHTVFAYVIDGRGCFDRKKGVYAANESLVLWDKGERVVLSTEARPARLLLVSGKPIGEPIAWQGPIVMNTQEELALAFRQYRQGTFIQT